jgi:chemotaxis protein methyltransferase CheR
VTKDALMPANFTMSDAQFNKLRKIIYDKSGIHFPDTKKYVLESRLVRRLTEMQFDNFDTYLMYLTVGPYADDEFQELFNRVTINETSFFRNEPQLDYFEKVILPPLIESRKSARTLRIWSSACSTGEEPYTLAIQLHRSFGVLLSDWRVEILGTDISEKVLIAAQTGRYSSYSMRSTSKLVMQRYFKDAGGFYQIDPAIQAMVRFELLNLKDTFAARRFGTFDVIFCRNVLIYFDDAMKNHCVKLFHQQLANDGTLFIGHSETLRGVEVPFVNLPEPQAFAYQKSSGGVSPGITPNSAIRGGESKRVA